MSNTRLYRLYIPCELSESGWNFILEHPDRQYTDEEFKQTVVKVMQELQDGNGEVGFGDVFEELIKLGFVESNCCNLSWTDAMDSVII
jgi:hypothetical protein